MSSKFNKTVEDFFKNYQDRGMVKWAGYFLSDHTAKINQDDEKKSAVYAKRAEMTFSEISQYLLDAYARQLPISIQKKILKEDFKYSRDLEGYVKGFSDENDVVIEDLKGNAHVIRIMDVNYVRWLRKN